MSVNPIIKPLLSSNKVNNREKKNIGQNKGERERGKKKERGKGFEAPKMSEKLKKG